MNSEYPICLRCKISDTCHGELLPVIVGRAGTVIPITDRHKHIVPTWCGNYTCGQDGERSAREAIQDNDKYETFQVTEVDNNTREVLAIPFGSSEKRTDYLKHRIITAHGEIYALQNGMYYSTQKLD